MHLTQVLSPNVRTSKLDPLSAHETNYHQIEEDNIKKQYQSKIKDINIEGNTLNWQLEEKNMKKELHK
jgi:hypothetical protein